MGYGFEDNKEKAIFSIQTTQRDVSVYAQQVAPSSGMSRQEFVFSDGVARDMNAYFSGQNFLNVSVECNNPLYKCYFNVIGGLTETAETATYGQYIGDAWIAGGSGEKLKAQLYIKKILDNETYKFYFYINVTTNTFSSDVTVVLNVRPGTLEIV